MSLPVSFWTGICPWTKNGWAAQSNKGWNLGWQRLQGSLPFNVWLLRGNFSMKRCQVELKIKQLNSNTLAIKRYNSWDKCKERDRKKFPVTHEYSCWRESPAQTLFMSPWSLTLDSNSIRFDNLTQQWFQVDLDFTLRPALLLKGIFTSLTCNKNGKKNDVKNGTRYRVFQKTQVRLHKMPP